MSPLELAEKIATAVKMADLTHNLSNLNSKKDRQRIDKYELSYLYLWRSSNDRS